MGELMNKEFWRPTAWRRWWGNNWADYVTIEKHELDGKWFWTCTGTFPNKKGHVEPAEWSGVLSTKNNVNKLLIGMWKNIIVGGDDNDNLKEETK